MLYILGIRPVEELAQPEPVQAPEIPPAPPPPAPPVLRPREPRGVLTLNPR
jgi:hypothetical protein